MHSFQPADGYECPGYIQEPNVYIQEKLRRFGLGHSTAKGEEPPKFGDYITRKQGRKPAAKPTPQPSWRDGFTDTDGNPTAKRRIGFFINEVKSGGGARTVVQYAAMIVLLLIGCYWVLADEFTEDELEEDDKQQVSTPSTEPKLPEDISIMVDWLHDNGAYIHDCLSVVNCPPGGRCVKATCELEAGESLVRIPKWVQISSEFPTQQLDAPHGEVICPQMEEYLESDLFKEWHLNPYTMRLVLRLLEERRRGPHSRWSYFIPTMPQSFDAYLWNETVQHSCLAGTPGEVHINRRFRRREAELQLLRKCGEGALHEDTSMFISKSDLPEKADVGDDILNWARLIIASRAYMGPPEQDGTGQKSPEVLVPFADLFNDALTPNANWRRHGLNHDVHPGLFEITAAETIPAGKEVSISYGAKTNEHLLTHYGFVHRDNKEDVLHIDMLDQEEGDMLSFRNAAAGRLALSLNENETLRSLPMILRAIRQHITERKQAEDRRAEEVHKKAAPSFTTPPPKDVLGNKIHMPHQAEVVLEAQSLAHMRGRCEEAAFQWGHKSMGAHARDSFMCLQYRAVLADLAESCNDMARGSIAALAMTLAYDHEYGLSLEIIGLGAKGTDPVPLRAADGKLASHLMKVWIESAAQRLPAEWVDILRTRMDGFEQAYAIDENWGPHNGIYHEFHHPWWVEDHQANRTKRLYGRNKVHYHWVGKTKVVDDIPAEVEEANQEAHPDFAVHHNYGESLENLAKAPHGPQDPRYAHGEKPALLGR
eukprot:gnl/TRDRNA2_/TRDRNA2_130698_c0_seq1.p1 gnl/TRDRNA2_/TRDRNA2_130698_c0~~gnl/TRDRNA2_/TRDRNA2_130698_c0_seq1.p1  ORF type:complete len:766 (-),score=128.66 gnl/TRDRNA2_/TRDRNA2_130698_c0_seq1:61-2358(-)